MACNHAGSKRVSDILLSPSGSALGDGSCVVRSGSKARMTEIPRFAVRVAARSSSPPRKSIPPASFDRRSLYARRILKEPNDFPHPVNAELVDPERLAAWMDRERLAP